MTPRLRVRAAVWLAVFVVCSSLEKPAGSRFSDLRQGSLGWIALGLIAVGVALLLWSMLWLDRVVRDAAAPTS